MGKTDMTPKDRASPATWLADARSAMERRPVLTRWLLAGPGAIAAGLVTMAAMAVWLPEGAAGVNNIAMPILLTPLLWAVPFFYACLAEDVARAAAVMIAATLAQGALVVIALT